MRHCPICKSIRPVVWDRNGWQKCRTCHAIVCQVIPRVATLAELYKTSWKTPHESTTETGGTSDHLARVYVRRLVDTLSRHDLSGLDILDFGAGRGAVVQAMTEVGAQVSAVDPFGRQYLQGLGFNAYDDITRLPPGQRFDGITSFDVLEHITDCAGLLRQLRGYLKAGGWLLLQTPNADSLRARRRRERWEELGKPGHLVMFAPRSLACLLEACGFAQYRRLNWFVPYSDRMSVNAMHYGLRMLRLDGALRYIAWNT